MDAFSPQCISSSARSALRCHCLLALCRRGLHCSPLMRSPAEEVVHSKPLATEFSAHRCHPLHAESPPLRPPPTSPSRVSTAHMLRIEAATEVHHPPPSRCVAHGQGAPPATVKLRCRCCLESYTSVSSPLRHRPCTPGGHHPCLPARRRCACPVASADLHLPIKNALCCWRR
jgi:hypothetical protein